MKTAPAVARRLLLPCLLALLAGALSACAGNKQTGFIVRDIYPSNVRQSKSLDIQVFRNDTRIRFTNTTATALPACTMWINAWFSRPLPAVAIGESVQLSLFDFKDQFGDTFRAGGFFASHRPTKLVLAQLQTSDELLGLIVVAEQE